MNDQKDIAPEDSMTANTDRATGVKLLVFVFALPLALVFLAQWLVF